MERVEEVFETGCEVPVDPIVRGCRAVQETCPEVVSETVAMDTAITTFEDMSGKGSKCLNRGDLLVEYERLKGEVDSFLAVLQRYEKGQNEPASAHQLRQGVAALQQRLTCLVEDPQVGYLVGGRVEATIEEVPVEVEQGVRQAKLESLLARLDRVEQAVGKSFSGRSIPSLVEELEHKVTLAKPLQVAKLTEMSKAYGQQLAALEGHVDGVELSECMKAMEQWEGLSQQLPVIVDRLQEMHTLHIQRTVCLQKAQEIEKQQQQLVETLAQQQVVLEGVQAAVEENVKKMAAHMEGLST